jgi:hypothetical protein
MRRVRMALPDLAVAQTRVKTIRGRLILSGLA